MTSLRGVISINWMLALVLVACGDDGGPTIDGPVAAIDGPASTADAPVATPDAPVVVPDATVVVPDATVISPDATVVPPDAMIGPDSGPVDIATACTNVCDHVYMDCFMAPTDPECTAGCTVDLADCTPSEVSAVHACGEVPCGGMMAEGVADCLSMIACIDF
jgi:hypothetical protein